jgi:membrane-bound ClpP family serine protease
LGVTGALFLIVSVVLVALQGGGPLEVLLFFVALVAALAFVVMFAIKRIRGTGKKGTMYLETDQEGYIASQYDVTAVGKSGVAVTDLKPAGHALVEGKYYQVVSQSGYVTQGTSIIVIGGQGAALVVKPSHKETSV